MMTADAMKMLFDHSKESMSAEDLKSLAGLSSQADFEIRNIAAALDNLAMMFVSSDKGARPTDFQISQILTGLSSNAAMLAEMISIGTEAAYLANKSSSQ